MIIEELLNRRIDDINAKIDSTDNQIKLLQADKTQLYTVLNTLYKEMTRVCVHPKDLVKESAEYTEGDYYNKSTTKYTWTCTQCKTILKTEEKCGHYA